VPEAKSTEDNTATETVATGTDGASEAQINKGKEPVASASIVEPDVEKPQEKIVKKKMTLKRRITKITVTSDSEGTED
ncbi:hypothetical protein A2U01_0096179, partial [Trifolium medium]|nr:hypothetical protein [Trifolium medium]